MYPAAIPSDPYTIVAVLFLLFGVPAILFGFLLLYTGYVRYDAEQYLEELEDADLEDLETDEIGAADVEDLAAAGDDDSGDEPLEREDSEHDPFETTDDTTDGFQTTDDTTDDGTEYSVFDDEDADRETDSGEYSVFENDDSGD